jgi:CobQ-like glutamine amidotransferase family enzyme
MSVDRAPFTIVSFLPELLDTNGDAGNARVLAQRARWAGRDARVVDVRTPADLPDDVHAVVLGSGTDASLVPTRDALLPFVSLFREWSTGGVPILAVGTGWELLSWGIELKNGEVIEGLGLVAGRAVPLVARETDDLVFTSKYGRLIGFENHARGYTGAEGSPLGRVVTGTGNGGGQEGVVMGSVFCTHLHGPVLARNPRLADHILTVAESRAHGKYAPGARSATVDDIAKAARNSIAVRLGLASE